MTEIYREAETWSDPADPLPTPDEGNDESRARDIPAVFGTSSRRIRGSIRTTCDRLVDHLNQAAILGTVAIEDSAPTEQLDDTSRDAATRATELQVADIVFASPNDLDEPPAYNPQAWIKKSWQTVHVGAGRYVIVGNIYLPVDPASQSVFTDMETLPPFVVLTKAVIHDLKALAADERYDVLLVNSRRINYVIRPM